MDADCCLTRPNFLIIAIVWVFYDEGMSGLLVYRYFQRVGIRYKKVYLSIRSIRKCTTNHWVVLQYNMDGGASSNQGPLTTGVILIAFPGPVGKDDVNCAFLYYFFCLRLSNHLPGQIHVECERESDLSMLRSRKRREGPSLVDKWRNKWNFSMSQVIYFHQMPTKSRCLQLHFMLPLTF